MIPGALFYSVPYEYEMQLAAINSKYLQRMADRIGKIGRLSSADIHRLDQLRRYGSDYDEMVSELSTLTNKTKTNIRDLIQAAAKNSYDDAKTVAALKKLPLIPFAENVALQRTIMAIAEQTVGTFMNLSRTSVVGYSVKDAAGRVTFMGLGEAYRNTVDMAINELSMGVTDFPSAMRQTLNSLADSGLRTVDYASGATRRLDSAVRMNILDGVRDVYQGVQDQVGKEIGTDGVEISAHGGCAPDHLPYQGRQYSKKEFNAIQDSLERPFGKWNCRHMWNAIILGVSRPAYSEQQLDDLRRMSEDTFEFDGKEYTQYEATQLQRKIETAVRASKDRANLAKSTGDHHTRVTEQLRINRLKQKYKDLSDAAGLPYKSERMSVSGFRPVGVSKTIAAGTKPKVIKPKAVEIPKYRSRIDPETIKSLKNVKTSVDEIEKNFIQDAVQSNFTEKEISDIEKKFKDGIDKFDFTIRAPDDKTELILNDGRFKTQFETHTSGGAFDPGYRKRASRNMFGYADDLADNEFEIYGCLDDPSDAISYGDIRFILKKDNVFDRTTVTIGDSLYYGEIGDMKPSLVSDPKVISYRTIYKKNAIKDMKQYIGDYADEIKDKGNFYHGSYVELQYHGGITLDDVEYIIIPENSRYKGGIINIADKIGLKWIINK